MFIKCACYLSDAFSPLIFIRCRKLRTSNTRETLCSSCKEKEDRYVHLLLNRVKFMVGFKPSTVLALPLVPQSQLSDLPPTMLKMDYAAVPLAQT